MGHNKLVFISQWGEDTKGINGGNVKKVLSQIKTLEKNGFEVKKVIKNPPRYISKPTLLDRITTKAKNIIPFMTNQQILHYHEVGEADYYYIRFYAYDYYFAKLLREIKEKNPSSKIVLEYSDFPYLVLPGRDPVGDYLVKLRDEIEKRRSLIYVDRISTPVLLQDRKIDGKECLRIQNGIDVDSFPLKRKKNSHDEVHALIVASLQSCHGVDRFLNGMIEYYRGETHKDIILHIVGGGQEEKKLIEIAKPLGDRVIFHGFLYDDELDDMYDKCDIGLEILAPHRREIKISSSLKSREYIARGLPFVSACVLDINKLGFTEYCKIDDSDAPVSMEHILEYYNKFSREYDSNVRKLREFAIKYLSMDYAMKEVIQYFESGA